MPPAYLCIYLRASADGLTVFDSLSTFEHSIYVCPAERPPGYDRVRNAEIGNKDFELDVLEEAYTTEHWLVRIYKVPPFTFLFLV